MRRKRSILFGIHAEPHGWFKWFLYLAAPVLFLVGYQVASMLYLADNPDGKIVPSFTAMGFRLWELAFTSDFRTDTYLLWADTYVSLGRLFTGLAVATVVGLVLGMNIAMFPGLQYLVLPPIVAFSFVPMMALLPILLIVLGIGEGAKVTLIFLGLVFFVTRDMYAATLGINPKLILKARTLGASELALVYQIVLPMILPRLFESVRLNLGPAWLFLIMGEAIASAEGLAYRIFLARRTTDMATILPYVCWITLLAICIYYLLAELQRYTCHWEGRK